MQHYSLNESDILNGGKVYSNVIGKYFMDYYEEQLDIRDELKNISFDVFIDIDGCDRDGPESYLYTMLVKWNDKKKRKFAQVWYRENWFEGEDNQKFELLDYVPISIKDKMQNYVLVK